MTSPNISPSPSPSPSSSSSSSSSTNINEMPLNNRDKHVPLCTCPQPAPCPPFPQATYKKYSILHNNSYNASLRRRRFEQQFLDKENFEDLYMKLGVLQQVFLIRETESVGEGPLAYLLGSENASEEVLVLMQIWGDAELKTIGEEEKWARGFFDECVEEGIVGLGREVKGGSLEERQTRERCTLRYWESVRDTLENVRRSGVKYLKIDCDVCGGVVV
ncbi:MAG: hypothetical protein M1812_005989 [Candelaria pacifica]|nr:MAG: hypothetical protein M1812_005989 [Candelaria pacifica]